MESRLAPALALVDGLVDDVNASALLRQRLAHGEGLPADDAARPSTAFEAMGVLRIQGDERTHR